MHAFKTARVMSADTDNSHRDDAHKSPALWGEAQLRKNRQCVHRFHVLSGFLSLQVIPENKPQRFESTRNATIPLPVTESTKGIERTCIAVNKLVAGKDSHKAHGNSATVPLHHGPEPAESSPELPRLSSFHGRFFTFCMGAQVTQKITRRVSFSRFPNTTKTCRDPAVENKVLSVVVAVYE